MSNVVLSVQYAKAPGCILISDLVLPIYSSIHFQVWFYFTWTHLFYTKGVFAWDIITFVTFMHCYRSRIFDLHIASYPGRSWSEYTYINQYTFFHWLYNLHWIFNLKLEMRSSFTIINSTSLVNNSKPNTWHFWQDLIVLDPP